MEVQGSGQISRNKNENTKGKSLTNVLPNIQNEGGGDVLNNVNESATLVKTKGIKGKGINFQL